MANQSYSNPASRNLSMASKVSANGAKMVPAAPKGLNTDPVTGMAAARGFGGTPPDSSTINGKGALDAAPVSKGSSITGFGCSLKDGFI